MRDNEEILKAVSHPGRRSFFKDLGKLGLGAAGMGLIASDLSKLTAQTTTGADTANQIFTAALVAEDLATTFYYNGLIGGVIEDPNLAGPGGTALLPSSPSNIPNVDYLRAAYSQEITHANLLRAVANLGSGASSDPYQTFYFPPSTFATLSAFTTVLYALESAFIGAYLVAVREFSALAAQTPASVPDGPFGGPYSSGQLQYFAQVAASIIGVEAEHRVLGGVILNQNQPNNLNFEQTDGLLTVYSGANSAVAALTPFLTASNGSGYSLASALSEQESLGLPSNGNPPSAKPAVITANPNPIPVKAGQLGVTNISWNAPSASIIQVRVNAPDGPVLTDNGNVGSMMTAAWVTNGTSFYLQDASNGNPTLASNTLASVTVTLSVTS